MADEMTSRVRSLHAERSRPDAKPRTTEDLIGDLVAALAALYKTPPDRRRIP